MSKNPKGFTPATSKLLRNWFKNASLTYPKHKSFFQQFGFP